MCSSNSVNGIPVCAHVDLLNAILKKEFGMSGAVISDGNAVADIYHQPQQGHNPGHEYAHSWAEAAADALTAGCDMSWDGDLKDTSMRIGDEKNGTVVRALAAKLITMEDVKQAAKHTLLPRIRVGLYDPPNTNPWQSVPASVFLSPAHVALAVRAATETVTLLRHKAGTLPLGEARSGGPKVIGVIGTCANNSKLSIDRYSGNPPPEHITTFLQGLTARTATAGSTVSFCSPKLQPEVCASQLKKDGVNTQAIYYCL